MVNPQTTQAPLKFNGQPAARGTSVIALITHGQKRLGGQDYVFPATGNRFSDHLFRLPTAIHICRVDEIDTARESVVDDGDDLFLRCLSHSPKVHRAEREAAYLDAGAAECAVLQSESSVDSFGQLFRHVRRRRML